MPGRVHAIVVVRPDGRTPAAFHLRRTLAALARQTRRPDDVTIVICGTDPAVEDALADETLPHPGAVRTRIQRMPARTRFAAATAQIDDDADLIWLLAQDTTPEPDALEKLAGQLELSPSLGFVAPKLVRADDPERIVSLGVSMTGLDESVELAAGDLDQGQHDTATDVLGSDIRAVLVRSSVWRDVRGVDPALRGADEGLDLAVSVRLRGGRIALVPTARVGVDGDGVAGLPFADTGRRRLRLLFRRRTAHLHRWLVRAPVLAVALVWLSLPPLALVRSLWQLVTKEPVLIAPEWAATTVAMVRVGAIARARRRMRRHRTVPWSRLNGLRVSSSVARERAHEGSSPVMVGAPRGELRFFSGGGAWLVVAMAAVSVAALPALLAWPALGGGALAPLRDTVAQLWADASFGLLPAGWNVTGAPDPFAGLVAVLGTLSPLEPSRALVLLWLAALPLAALGGWFAATRITDRAALRVIAGLAWVLAPTFLVALVDGVPTGVIVHLLLPWLVYAGAVAHRSWVPAAAASLLIAAVVASAPSLAPALTVLLIAGVIAAIARRSGAAFARMLWLPIPMIALFAPLAWMQLRAGSPWALLADPGAPIPGAVMSVAPADRVWIALGFPTAGPAGWEGFIPGIPTWWVPLLIAPLALLAACAAMTARWPIGLVHLAVIVLGVGTAIGVAQIAVRFDGEAALAGWPGAGLSLAWWGLVGAASLTLDQVTRAELRRYRSRRPGVLAVTAAWIMVIGLGVLAAPALSASARGAAALTNGPVATLPAYVAAEAGAGARVGTIAMTPQDDGAVAVRVVWGASDTLGSFTTLLETRTTVDAPAAELAAVAASLATSTTPDAVATLADEGIAFVLLSLPTGEVSTRADTARREIATALDQRDDLDPVGATDKGELWRVTVPVATRPGSDAPELGAGVTAAQLSVLLIALLLAIPTRRTRAAARLLPRIVGKTRAEGEDAAAGRPRAAAGPDDVAEEES